MRTGTRKGTGKAMTAVLLMLAVATGAFGLGAVVLHVWPTFVGVRHEKWAAGDLAMFVAGPGSVLASLWLWSEWWARWRKGSGRPAGQGTSAEEEGKAESALLEQRGRAGEDRT